MEASTADSEKYEGGKPDAGEKRRVTEKVTAHEFSWCGHIRRIDEEDGHSRQPPGCCCPAPWSKE